MSSFICSAKHFQSVENSTVGLFKDFYDGKYTAIYPYFTKESVPELWSHYGDFNEKLAYSKIRTMVNTMREINVRCVVLQYAAHYENVEEAIETNMFCVKAKTVGVQLSKIALYKAIQCLFYQIEIHHLTNTRELTASEKQAMKFFEELNVEIAENVVKNTAEYNDDKTRWSID